MASDTAAMPSAQRPDRLVELRLGQLLILLDVLGKHAKADWPDIDRIGACDFFAANPFLVFDDEPIQRRELVMAGFDSQNLSYQSSAQRFSNRRARLRSDLAQLVALGLAAPTAANRRVVYALTDNGREVASKLTALYARSYRTSAAMIVAKLSRLSDKRINEQTRQWLKADAFLIDIYDVEGTS